MINSKYATKPVIYKLDQNIQALAQHQSGSIVGTKLKMPVYERL